MPRYKSTGSAWIEVDENGNPVHEQAAPVAQASPEPPKTEPAVTVGGESPKPIKSEKPKAKPKAKSKAKPKSRGRSSRRR